MAWASIYEKLGRVYKNMCLGSSLKTFMWLANILGIKIEWKASPRHWSCISRLKLVTE